MTEAQHKWLDYENARLVDWANQKEIAGKNDWTGEQVQAAMWVRQKAEDLAFRGTDKTPPLMERMRAQNMAQRETAIARNQPPPALMTDQQLHDAAYAEGFNRANTTGEQGVPRNVAYATREMQPGIPGHLPGAAAAPQSEREEFFRGASWLDPTTGHDIIYGGARSPSGAGLFTLPGKRMQGIWRPDPSVPPEYNPGVAIPFFPGTKTGAAGRFSDAGRDLAQQAEGLSAFLGAQAAGGATRFLPGGAVNAATGYGFALPRALTEKEMETLQAVGAAHGFPHVVDTGGDGVMFANYDGPEPQTPQKAKTFKNALNQVRPQESGPATHGLLEGVSTSTEYGRPGSGDATRKLTQLLGKNWTSWNMWNNHPTLYRIAQPLLDNARKFAEQWGEPREDWRNVVKVAGSGPGWLERLDNGRRYGLPDYVPKYMGPGVAAGVVALTPSAGVPAEFPQRPEEEPVSVRMARRLRASQASAP